MAITVGVNTYITESDYIAYATARGIELKPELEADIIKSADFIDTYYTFKGAALDAAQDMQLPTDCVAIADIKKAALKAVELQQAGLLTLDSAVMTGGIVESESKSLDGVGSKSVTYASGSQPTYKARTPELDRLLQPYLAFSGGLRKS